MSLSTLLRVVLSTSILTCFPLASVAAADSESEVLFDVTLSEPLRGDISKQIVDDLVARGNAPFVSPNGTPITTPHSNGKDPLEFCHTAKWSKPCLFGLLTYRCVQYSFPFGAAPQCSTAAAAFSDLLQLKRIDVTVDGEIYNLPLIFTKRLERLIQDPRTQADLRELQSSLETALNTNVPFDLWKWALRVNQGNTERTLEWLSTLLQDTSLVQIQISYLEQISAARKFSSATKKAITVLGEISYFLAYENLEKREWKTWLRLYPTAGIEADTTPLIYHLYPMAYTALLMKKMGFGDRLSSFIPFLFNTEYILQSLDPESWPLKHPRASSVDLTFPDVQWKMRDMYGGLAGGLLGVGKISRAPGLQKFQSIYAKNPYAATRSLYWAMPL